MEKSSTCHVSPASPGSQRCTVKSLETLILRETDGLHFELIVNGVVYRGESGQIGAIREDATRVEDVLYWREFQSGTSDSKPGIGNGGVEKTERLRT